jgi:hypothetical protein
MMKLALKALRLLPVVLIVLALLAASPVSAADRGLNVKGAILKVDVSPGQTLTHTMTVSIGTDDQATEITVRIGDFGQSLSGSYELLEPAGNNSLSACPFITLDKESFHLEPGGSDVVTATIRVPEDVGAGGRYALINIKTGVAGNGGVGMITAVNVPIVLTVKGTTLLCQGEVSELGIGVAGDQALDISTIFHNTGNYLFKFKGEITINRFKGEVVGNIALPLTSGSLIPDMSLQLWANYSPEEVLAKGIYIVKSRVMLEDDTVLAEKSAAFEVTETGIVILPEVPDEGTPINWFMLGGIIGGVVVIGLLTFFLVRRRRSRYPVRE